MGLRSCFTNVIRLIGPRKSLCEVIESQNTKAVYYPRVRSWPKKYVYGKVPGVPIVNANWHPEGAIRSMCIPETDDEVIRRHIAICRQEEGSHGGLCEMCRKLNNPKRLEFLARLYRDRQDVDTAGFCVNDAVDGSVLKQPATSQYLHQLSALGMVRRERCGRLVSYRPDYTQADPFVREIAAMLRTRFLSGSEDMSFVPIFRVMMGPLRARVVRHVAAGGDGQVAVLAQMLGYKMNDLIERMTWAVHGGILDLDSEDEFGRYRYIVPADSIARRIVELS